MPLSAPQKETFLSYLGWLHSRGLTKLMPRTSLPDAPLHPEIRCEGFPSAKVLFFAYSLSDEACDLFSKMRAAMQLGDEWHLTSLTKAADISDGSSILLERIETVHPSVVVLMGADLAHAVMGDGLRFESIRGRMMSLPAARNIQFIATYHPSDLLGEPSLKRAAWQDLQLVMRSVAAPGGN